MVFVPAQFCALTTIAAETLRCAVPQAITATAHKLGRLIYRSFGYRWRDIPILRVILAAVVDLPAFEQSDDPGVVAVAHHPPVVRALPAVLAVELDDGVLQVPQELLLDILEDQDVNRRRCMSTRRSSSGPGQSDGRPRRGSPRSGRSPGTCRPQLEHDRREVLRCGGHDDLPYGRAPVKKMWSHFCSSRAVVSGTAPSTTEKASASRYWGISLAGRWQRRVRSPMA